MIKRLILTDEHLKLIRLIKFSQYAHKDIIKGVVTEGWMVDKTNPYILSGRLSDLALVLGYSDKAIPGTDDVIEGSAFPDDIEEHLLEVHQYIVKNMCDIESLIHQMVMEGGLTAGTYKSIDEEGIWTRESD